MDWLMPVVVEVVVVVHLVVVLGLVVSMAHVVPVVVMRQVNGHLPAISVQTGALPREVGPGTFDGFAEQIHPCFVAR